MSTIIYKRKWQTKMLITLTCFTVMFASALLAAEDVSSYGLSISQQISDTILNIPVKETASPGAPTHKEAQGKSRIEGTDKKPWMDYRMITDETSKQYEIICKATPDEHGLMKAGDAYLVALGSAYGPVGTRLTVELSTGKTIVVVKADEKQARHTENGEGVKGIDGHIIEMIVDENLLNKQALYHGNCNVLEDVKGEVVSIQREGTE